MTLMPLKEADAERRLSRVETLAAELIREIAELRAAMAAEDLAPTQSMGTAIQVARVRIGMSRPELAKRSGISYPYLAEIEKDRKQAPLRTVRKLADALGVPPSSLIVFQSEE